MTALHWGAANTAKARLLLESNADVNAVLTIGRTPLFVASANGTAESVRLLLARGAQVNVADNVGITPAHHCCPGQQH